MPVVNEPTFDAPIPGMSLTHELGARPWQSPPQFPTVDDAIEYYMSQMTSEEFMDQLVDLMEMGIPLTTIANSMQLAGVMQGKHTVDVGMLVVPLLLELMMMIAESAEIEYDSGLENPNKNKTRKSLLAKYVTKFEKEAREAKEAGKRAKQNETVEEPVEAEEATSIITGLMARRQ